MVQPIDGNGSDGQHAQEVVTTLEVNASLLQQHRDDQVNRSDENELMIVQPLVLLPLAQTHHDYTVSATDHDNNKYEAENVDAVVSEHATNAPAITNHHHEPCHTSSDDDKNDDQSVETPPLPRHRHECVCVTIDEDDLATSSSSDSI
jgi:hypothetical protein